MLNLPYRVRLIGGTLKIKRYWHLRFDEREHYVPVKKLGRIYFTWRAVAVAAT